MRQQDPLIVGAGPAGTAAAIVLARGGTTPVILDRQTETGNAICGGFLSWATLDRLESLGVRGLEGHPMTHVRVFSGKRCAEARLPSLGLGVSRYRLDTVMQRVAIAAGAVIERGVTVREIEGDVVRTDRGEREAQAIFLANGKHDIRGEARPRAADDPTLGLRVRLTPHSALDALIENTIELHMFDRGYVGLCLQEGRVGNLCLAVRKSRLAEAGGKPEALLAEIGRDTPLGERLAFMEAMPAVDAIAAVPYGWQTRQTRAGLFRLGDQAAVIPSLAGEGIGIALASGVAAAEAWAAGGAEAAVGYQETFYRRARRPVAAASLFWAIGERPRWAYPATAVFGALPGAARLIARATRIGG